MKRTIFILVVAALLVAWLVLRRPPAAHRGGVGELLRPAPDFSLTDLSGAKLILSGYRGKVVLLDFWATWCDPCKTEIPHFIEMQNRYGRQGFQVIGISMDDDEKLVREFQQQFKMNYPVAMGNADLAGQYGGILGLPITFVLDRQGRITARHIGATDASVFEAEIRKLLETPSPD
ncbi:MAG: TlpA family protein disulfide reductase [Acidobacteriales bacterium]|nr:TlpA family protein disulfide reductase [Candidatus Koribacter versatilis]MBI3645734.1 TlpA family protein disulfide reductase [Terriglobales bacterium]